MTHWKALAAAAEPPIREDLLPDVAAALEKLETAFRQVAQAIPPDTLLWSLEEPASEDAS